MPDDMRNARRRGDPPLAQQAFDRATALLDTDQPSDGGFDDYDLDPEDEVWVFLDDAAVPTPSAVDSGGSTVTDRSH